MTFNLNLFNLYFSLLYQDVKIKPEVKQEPDVRRSTDGVGATAPAAATSGNANTSGHTTEYSLRRRPRKDYVKMIRPEMSSNGLVRHKPNKILDFKTIEWPRDALYIPYPFGEKFEYMADIEARSVHFDVGARMVKIKF